jgi:hypothetical protein
MGYIFIFDPVGGSQADGVRYAQQLTLMHEQQITVQTIIKSLFEEENKLDIFQALVTLGVSFFTDNPHVLFFVFALIFGFFYSRNVWIILSYSKEKPVQWYVWIAIIMFLLVNPIWNINGVRMWIALHVFVYGVLNFIVLNRKGKIFWCFFSVLIHFSFILPLTLLFVFFLLPKKNITFYFVVFFMTAIFSQLDIQGFKNGIVDYLPQKVIPKVEDYMSEDYVESRSKNNSELSKYIGIQQYMQDYFEYLILIFLWIEIKNKRQISKTHSELLIMFLFFGSVTNVLDAIPSMARFWSLNNMLFFALLLLILFDRRSELSVKMHSATKYLAVLLILPELFAFRIGCDYYGNTLLWGNFLSATFIEDRTPIIQFVKSIL